MKRRGEKEESWREEEGAGREMREMTEWCEIYI